MTTDKIGEAASVLTRVFGVASVSPALISGSSMDAMAEKTASYSRTVLKEGQGFAIKARREGNHPYTSMDVGREVGSAVFLANEDRKVRVDLTDPDVTFYSRGQREQGLHFRFIYARSGRAPHGQPGKGIGGGQQ